MVGSFCVILEVFYCSQDGDESVLDLTAWHACIRYATPRTGQGATLWKALSFTPSYHSRLGMEFIQGQIPQHAASKSSVTALSHTQLV